MTKHTYSEAIRSAFEYLLSSYSETFVIGQGLWSPWYVGDSMTELEKKFGTDRIIDTPVSEAATTGAAVGASLAGMKPIVVHPRMDFMLYAIDPIVNQAAKWSHMFGGQAHPGVTVRGIVNRGGEQGAQHSQALHSWFAHVPGLRVVMPATVADARDLLIAAVLCPDPVLYIDDRWLYSQSDELGPIRELELATQRPSLLKSGIDVTVVGSSHSTALAMEASDELASQGVSVEVIDLRVLNPFDPTPILESVEKTRALVVVDGSWANAGFSAEVIAAVAEGTSPGTLRRAPQRVTLPASPAPTSSPLESAYYPAAGDVARAVIATVG